MNDRLLAAVELERRRRSRTRAYFSDPCGFARDCFGLELWEQEVEGKGAVGQAPIARAVARCAQMTPRKPVSVRSGHKVGKSSLAALLSIWWYFTRENGRVVVTSSSFTQIENINWPDISRLWRNSRFMLPGKLGETPRTGIDWNAGQKYVIGVATDRAENLGGYSGSDLLWLIDEASGINEEIFEAIEGNTAGNAMVVMFGNPTQEVGTFYDSHHEMADEYETFHLSSWDTPNARSGEDKVPGLAIRAWCQKRLDRWGENDPRYKVRVAGEFPNMGVATIFSEQLLASMFAEAPSGSRNGALAVGVDVARFGDDVTVIQPVQGICALEPITLHQADSTEIASAVKDVVMKHRGSSEVPVVRIDSIGVGWAVYDQLREVEWADVQSVNGSERLESGEHANVRSAMVFGLAEWARKGGKVPLNRLLRAELQVLRYEFDRKGKLLVEDKKVIRKRLRRSPDYSDALALAVYSEGSKTRPEYEALSDNGVW